MPMCISPYVSVLSIAGGQYCMHITCGDAKSFPNESKIINFAA